MNKQGHGPAWSNSLFEDNAEHGMGMLLGYEAVNNMLAADAEKLIATGVETDVADAAKAWLAGYAATSMAARRNRRCARREAFRHR